MRPIRRGRSGMGFSAPRGPPDQLAPRLQPRVEGDEVPRRLPQPGAQQASAHGGAGAVQDFEQSVACGPVSLVSQDLQVPPRPLVQNEVRVEEVRADAAQVIQWNYSYSWLVLLGPCA